VKTAPTLESGIDCRPTKLLPDLQAYLGDKGSDP
jgi:hypothetical protein